MSARRRILFKRSQTPRRLKSTVPQTTFSLDNSEFQPYSQDHFETLDLFPFPPIEYSGCDQRLSTSTLDPKSDAS
ncbi:hypothetical protein N7451_012920 [Penicillium sp. IBT 35674x]|nr:hypothetical protein N7451_012920 [Penicillium sp. IBT 35674x]